MTMLLPFSQCSCVKDSENKNTLAETTFEVEKLNVTTEDTAEGRARAEDIRNTEN